MAECLNFLDISLVTTKPMDDDYTFNTIDDIDLDISLNPNVITSPNKQTCSEFHQRKRSLSCSDIDSLNFLDISLNEKSLLLQNDDTIISENSQLENDRKSKSINQSECEFEIHTKNVIQHCLRSNISYKRFESTSSLINTTPGAKYQIPMTMHKIKNTFVPLLQTMFHIWCKQCKNYSPTTSKVVVCDSCSMQLDRAKAKYFVSFSLETQLIKSIENNFDEILSYRSRFLDKSDSIRDVYDGKQFKKVQEKYSTSIVLPLTVNTDGAEIFNSGRKSIWPIQIYQNYLHPSVRYITSNILVVGLHSMKPNMQQYFKPFLTELERIQKNGGITFHRNGKVYNFFPSVCMVTVDLPARADVQEIIGHSGYMACPYCLHPGILVKPKPNSKACVRYIQKTNVPQRTHDNLLNIYQRLNSKPINGVKSISCMVAACEFDLIKGFSLDYLHFVLLGVVKKLMDLWLNSKYHAKPYHISKTRQELLNKRILGIRPTSEISRQPRSIFERADYKANEYRTLLLYYLRYCLVDLLPMRFINNFQLLASSIYMLLKCNITPEDLSLAESRINQFANEYEALYGPENVTLNLHLCRHVVECVKNLGPLWSQSAFGFETNNGVLVRSNQAKRDYLHQISWKYTMMFTMNNDKRDETISKKLDIGGKTSIILSKDELNTFSPFSLEEKQTVYKFVKISGIKYTSSMCKEISTIDYFVSNINQNMIGKVKFFFVDNSKVYVFLEKFEIIEKLDQFLTVRSLNSHEIFEICDIETKMIYMKIDKMEIVTSIPNKFEKS